MAEGHKKIETRSWSTNIRGPVAIHAAKKSVKEATKLMIPSSLAIIRDFLFPFPLERLPLGYILATGNLVDCKRIDEAYIETMVETLKGSELALGDYTPGRYAWIFEDVTPFSTPIPAIGSQGFWDWKTPSEMEVKL
jgi:hypothetical protein